MERKQTNLCNHEFWNGGAWLWRKANLNSRPYFSAYLEICLPLIIIEYSSEFKQWFKGNTVRQTETRKLDVTTDSWLAETMKCTSSMSLMWWVWFTLSCAYYDCCVIWVLSSSLYQKDSSARFANLTAFVLSDHTNLVIAGSWLGIWNFSKLEDKEASRFSFEIRKFQMNDILTEGLLS